MPCPDDSELAAFAQHALNPEPARLVELHIDQCATCRQVLAHVVAAESRTHLSTTTLDATQPTRAEVGRTFGRYVVLELLGSGGMGLVYAAYDPQLDRKIALKLLHSGGEEGKTRLLREARAAARLTDPNVITVHDVGELGDEVFLASEFVDGGTLAEWLAQRPPPRAWKEVLTRFIAAGRGLVAAHARQIVHRDFKPANVLLGRDGRVLVTDFGLSRADASASGSPNADPRLTAAGTLVGTPAYMSPEQWQGQDADARSDQFSFCVSLFEGLYGARPFAGASTAELKASVDAGRITEPPAGRTVPRWLRRVLERGLEKDPARRWPSMGELLAALNKDPVTRLVRTASIGLGVLLVAGIAGGVWWSGEATARSCRAGAQRVQPVWAAKKDDVHAALGATKALNADAAWQGTERAIDTYVASWQHDWQDACDATHLRAQQSPQMLDQRLECLQDRLDEVAALVTGLLKADAKTVDRATEAAQKLSDLGACSATTLARSRIKPPKDATVQAQVKALRERLAQVRVTDALGAPGKARDLARGVVDDAVRCEYLPTRAEALMVYGVAQHRAGDTPGSITTLREATYAAEAADAVRTEIDAWSSLVRALAIASKLDEAHEAARHAQALLDRFGDEHEDATLQINLGELLATEGRYDEALTVYSRGRELELKKGNLADAAGAQVNVGRALDRLGRWDEAAVKLQDALASLEAIHGKSHPNVAIALNNLALNSLEQGQYDEAKTYAQRAVELREQTLGKNHMLVGRALGNLAVVLEAQGHFDEATRAYERVRDITTAAIGADHPLTADPLLDLGRLAARQGDFAQARSLMEKALAMIEKGLGAEHLNAGEALLQLAELERLEGKLVAAQTRIDRAAKILAKAPPDGVARLQLAQGSLAVARGNFAEGEQVLQAALARRDGLRPASRTVRAVLIAHADVLHRLHRDADAIAELQRAETMPENDQSLLHFTFAQALFGTDRAAAHAHAVQARTQWAAEHNTRYLRELDTWERGAR